MCEYIIPDDCSAIGDLSFPVWDIVRDIHVAGKLQPQNGQALAWILLWLLFVSRHGTYSQATPALLNPCATGYREFASNQRTVCKFNYMYLLSIYLVYLKTISSSRERYCGNVIVNAWFRVYYEIYPYELSVEYLKIVHTAEGRVSYF